MAETELWLIAAQVLPANAFLRQGCTFGIHYQSFVFGSADFLYPSIFYVLRYGSVEDVSCSARIAVMFFQSQYPSCENLLVELENNLQKARSRCIK